MGAAIATGLLLSGADPARIHGFDADAAKVAAFGGTGSDSVAALESAVDIVIVAVKPHIVPAILPQLSGRSCVVSVAAGVTLTTLESGLPDGTPVVRAMPNTAAAVGKSTTALVATAGASEDDVSKVVRVFDAVGTTVRLDREELMHVATAIVGSGPAFVYVLAEALADGAVAGGMPRALAREAVSGMLTGAAALLAAHDGSPAELKDRVASPGGTTIAGVRALEIHGMRNAAIEAVLAAAARSEELA
jgi:pyrroline-5-carboxylate reductase